MGGKFKPVFYIDRTTLNSFVLHLRVCSMILTTGAVASHASLLWVRHVLSNCVRPTASQDAVSLFINFSLCENLSVLLTEGNK
jgi:hypothetical protein